MVHWWLTVIGNPSIFASSQRYLQKLMPVIIVSSGCLSFALYRIVSGVSLRRTKMTLCYVLGTSRVPVMVKQNLDSHIWPHHLVHHLGFSTSSLEIFWRNYWVFQSMSITSRLPIGAFWVQGFIIIMSLVSSCRQNEAVGVLFACLFVRCRSVTQLNQDVTI